jgi:hypothetical protein
MAVVGVEYAKFRLRPRLEDLDFEWDGLRIKGECDWPRKRNLAGVGGFK